MNLKQKKPKQESKAKELKKLTDSSTAIKETSVSYVHRKRSRANTIERKLDSKSKEAPSLALGELPKMLADSEVLNYLQTKDIGWKHVNAIKQLTDYSDEVISDWLNISVKTLRTYKQPAETFKGKVKENILLILSLVMHGIEVFGTKEKFEQWLNAENFFFDKKSPVSFLNTVTGIRFVNDKLTAIEYGDNV